jgi:hypothetical protein
MRAVEEIVRQWRQWQWQNREREESVEEDLDGVEDKEDFYEVEDDEMSTLGEQDQQLQAPLPPPPPPPPPLPYYIFSSSDMLAFLRA